MIVVVVVVVVHGGCHAYRSVQKRLRLVVVMSGVNGDGSDGMERFSLSLRLAAAAAAAAAAASRLGRNRQEKVNGLLHNNSSNVNVLDRLLSVCLDWLSLDAFLFF
jgi:hypothetical protein